MKKICYHTINNKKVVYILRLWDVRLLPYLPEAQFKGQLRELVAILHDWRDKGYTNHILINIVMEYPKQEFIQYFRAYAELYHDRFRCFPKNCAEFVQFCEPDHDRTVGENVFPGWHNEEYLRVCMANLYEKYKFGRGKSRITEDEWQKLLVGYKEITGKNYVI